MCLRSALCKGHVILFPFLYNLSLSCILARSTLSSIFHYLRRYFFHFVLSFSPSLWAVTGPYVKYLFFSVHFSFNSLLISLDWPLHLSQPPFLVFSQSVSLSSAPSLSWLLSISVCPSLCLSQSLICRKSSKTDVTNFQTL